MTKKNRIFLAAVLAVLLALLASCGKGSAGQQTETTPAQNTPSVYTVELCSDSGYLLENVGIYVYTDATQQELVWFARTDAEGKITFRDVTCEGYIAVLDGVSSDYIVEETYSLTGEHTLITVVAQMQSNVDLAGVTRGLGDVMFDFTITSSDGIEYTLSELLKEKDAIVLNFWYLNCTPCRMEFPYLQEAYEEYGDRIEVLAMNPVDGTDEEIAAFKKELELTFPMFQCDPEWASAMQLTAYPTTVVIDRFGVISLIHAGSVTSSKVFTDAFAHFTAEDYEQGTVENIEDLEAEVPGANPDEPVELGGVQTFQVTIPAGGEVHYHLYRVDGSLSVKNSNIYIEYGGHTYPASSSGASVYVKSPDTYTPAKLVFGNTGTETQTFTVNIAKPGGQFDNPYTAELNKEFTTKVAAGNEKGVYYQLTAPKAGYLIFECVSSPSKVTEFDYVMQSLSSNTQRTLKLDGNEERTMVSIKVSKGEKIKCWIVAEKDKSGNKYPGGTFKSKLYISDTPVKEEAEQIAKIDYAVTVTDENRKPVAGVYMNVDTGENKPVTISTNDKGVAHTKLVPGDYPIMITLPGGFSAETTEFTLTEARPFVSVKLDTLVVEMTTYTVTVTDEAGKPVKGITVMIGTQMLTTGEDGKATFTLAKGSHTVTVSKADGSVQNQTFAEGETEMTIVLGQGGGDSGSEEKTAYSVKVVDYDGSTHSGITVQFLKDGNPVAVQTTDGSGIASAELVSGNYTVALAASGLYYEEENVNLSADKHSLTLYVTDTCAKGLINEWFGPTYDKIGLGATYATTRQTNVVSYFPFTPEEEGTYKITVTDSKAKLSYWGGINYPIEQEAEEQTATSFQLNVKESNLGGTYAIGVQGASDYILVIERVGGAELDESDIPWEVYEGNPPSSKYNKNVGQKLTYVDLTGETSNFKPVLGSDGYYHLNSANGKILYVNLGPNAQYVPMYNMLGVSGVGGTKFGKTFRNSDGSVLKKEDYTSCMIAYVNCRNPQTGSAAFEVYPLTKDLMYMLKNGGESMGWWDENSEQFLFADLGSKFNPELGWMFAVCYVS